MNIEDLTLGQARQLAAIFGGSEAPSPHIGKKCVIRTYASGVHFGTVVAQNGRQVELKGARRLWKWHANGGISLSEVSQNGIDASKSRICQVVPVMTILDALEVMPATDAASATIEQAEVAPK